MDIEAVRQFCLGFPHTTENVQWGADLCFKVDGKMFAVVAIEMVPQRISFKCTPENFAALCERSGIIPAPYMARAQWVSLERLDALPDAELRDVLAESYRQVWENISKKRRAELDGTKPAALKPALKSAARKSAAAKPRTKTKPKTKTKTKAKTRAKAKAKASRPGRRK
ncbi:MAG: MmcQ/YjbR family DNA-binding protein [Acidobacteriota bacterium]|nr:MmcQ/YjbR family DNA-binding protein [Acidobacteriota bacterium]